MNASLRRQWQIQIATQFFVCCVVSALIAWSLWWSGFNDVTLRDQTDGLAGVLSRLTEFTSRFTHPEWSVTAKVFQYTLETLTMVIAATFLSVVIGFPLGFLAASNLTPWWVSQPVKGLLGLARAIPTICLALFFVALVGLGPLAGVLALAFHSFGMLGKFYAEELETADPGVVQAISGTGATWLQTIRFGLFPQSFPQLVAFTVFRFENNFRDATVLGLVGAGGIGELIRLYFGGFQEAKGAVLLVFIIAVVVLLDQFTYWTRKKIR